ncbi:hypothetical protein [Rossellomorea aquimaris]|uniref:N-acetyltransferase domain-containing protein n=1 Tax=Rossellomorea aquimaris TaxID=189382 RepID=A0A5D4UBG7_9BACI|nr:hypothetical protein [Rossellomorea aquimaris]TYS79022.1 hypothetical protein FZD05_10895 [Rossellomorea aquimaris]TYS84767.1 hypothetical protein FZC85_15525 [Rossellomorea aquimaris]
MCKVKSNWKAGDKMSITYKYFEGENVLALQYDFWRKITSTLPFAWKPTMSPILFKEQKEFDPRSRCFAYEGDDLIGYMSFTGKGDFVSLGYPWVLSGYEGIQDELFERVYGFAVSDEYGGRILAQRFREQWKDQILYFEAKGFEITNESKLIGKYLSKVESTEDNIEFSWKVSNEFIFEDWRSIMEENDEVNEAQIKMMEEYYSSVDFDFSISFFNEEQMIGVMGVTLREDTNYSEVLSFGILQEFKIHKGKMICVLMNEARSRGAETIIFHASDIPEGDIQKELGLSELTKDVMMVKEV